ncbi:MAG: OmpA family protein [Candidatus Thiodiazotropha endolucinida]
MKMIFVIVSVLFALTTPVSAADLVSPFSGSTPIGEYKADFVKYHYLPSAAADAKPATVDGRIHSRLYKKPDEKSNYEVIKSFENEFKAAGFKVLTLIEDTRQGELKVRDLNTAGKNGMLKRPYAGKGGKTGVGTVAQISTQAQEYLVARKTIDQTDVLIAVFTSRSGGYAIEQIESAAMEQGTVSLNLDAMRNKMASEGRVAIYGIRFDTGSANIRPDSAATLATIVSYLQENPQRYFYVVGHTDDQGKFTSNLTLSRARADAVVKAIIAKLPAAANRLQADGVGPLSPVATNTGTDGRRLNRRVELVSRLK